MIITTLECQPYIAKHARPRLIKSKPIDQVINQSINLATTPHKPINLAKPPTKPDLHNI